MDDKKVLVQSNKDINDILDLPSSEFDRPSEVDTIYDSDQDPEYKPSDCSESECDDTTLANRDGESSEHSDEDLNDPLEELEDPGEGTSNQPSRPTTNQQRRGRDNNKKKQPEKIIWKEVTNTYNPRRTVPTKRQPIVLADIDRGSTELQVFLEIFPKSLFMFIAHCTNERLGILNKQKKKRVVMSNSNEIMSVIGCILIMCYNRLPNISDYWSMHESMGNTAIKRVMSRNRFQLLISKLYFNLPAKPQNASKTYYVDELLDCFKYTFPKARSEATFQSIDESMAKFKGRSTLKQYVPLKPIKRGIKIWERCDSESGYCYDLNVYAGKDLTDVDGSLGERVVGKLSSTVRGDKKNVVLSFDRFFTSVKLISETEHPCVATCISNRVNVPKFEKIPNKYESEYLCCDEGVLAVTWKDSKQFTVLTNFHNNNEITVTRMQQNGQKKDVPCPEAIALYNEVMGGVDISDQNVNTYDFDRKSKKWWKKVFYKLILTSVVNAWILHQELQRKKKPLLSFMVPLAEQLLSEGVKNMPLKRKSSVAGRTSKRVKSMDNVGTHLPVEGKTRRRCKSCSELQVETRTKTMCPECNVPLCKNCFSTYHTQ